MQPIRKFIHNHLITRTLRVAWAWMLILLVAASVGTNGPEAAPRFSANAETIPVEGLLNLDGTLNVNGA
ncbi:MAG: hypothetical protein Q7O66_13505 [Dehalococcoidia bacterium]|nr:hypothetical protein [Dehalococcoidia bacterium]